ncbi:ABC transporter permease [Bacillus pseudomycoides]|uniref:ABC transporter permease n=1 Tax=Bacillus pseudomycoides TaxID=64104 RepID=UPI000BEBD351|nr:ABC transporter permease [Bacillus pseudomycoides]PED09585.1 ABC transporter permease [Bacillus pseudomycoides]PEI94857.1 ABC transporter permease [Bacillus pseudomycoides]PEK25962.1 ABC transporter permease [Bacillus pseudomycoides]PEM72215.1 ABC transporter permease [Bacillus pseudomycoides]PEO12223.1 ABC transporter permease [Bacillus pseudomycoides]
MNIFNIAIKEIKSDFRDIKTLVSMLAFPVVLMLILGTALTNAFNSDNLSIKNIQVLYKDEAGGKFSQAFETLIKETGKSGIHFKKAAKDVDGKEEVKQNKYAGYVEMNQNGVKLYESDRNSIEGSIIEGMLTTFVDKYNVAVEVATVDPGKVSTVISSGNHDDYIKETSLQAAKKPSSMDYYAIAMTTMIALYGAMGASYLIRGERLRKTGDRLIAAPVSKAEIFIGKILGSIVVNALCLFLVVFFSKFVYGANWGDHLGVVFLILLTEVFLAISFGLGIGYITKTGEASKAIIMVVVQLASIFGGAYFVVEENMITNLSPLTWANTAIMKIIYANEVGAALPVIFLNLGISALFLLIAIIALRRREGL